MRYPEHVSLVIVSVMSRSLFVKVDVFILTFA